MILLVPIEIKIVMHRHRQITARYVSRWMNPEGGSDFALVQIQGQPPVCSATMDKVPNKEKPNLAIIYLVFESTINQIN